MNKDGKEYNFFTSSECPLPVDHIDQRFFTLEGNPNKTLQTRLQKIADLIEQAFPNQEYTIYVIGGVVQSWKKKNYEGDLDILITIPNFQDNEGKPVKSEHWYVEGSVAEKLFNLVNEREKVVRSINDAKILIKGADATDISVSSFPPFTHQHISNTSYYYDFTHQKWGTVEPGK